ncbi:MAG: hypothetical protein ACYCYP_04665 [Leptospirales bacterium]
MSNPKPVVHSGVVLQEDNTEKYGLMNGDTGITENVWRGFDRQIRS